MAGGLDLISTIFFSILLTNSITGHSRRWFRTESRVTNVSHSDSQERIATEFISFQADTTRKDSKIIFPLDNADNQSKKYIPKPSPACQNFTFCESAVNYPNDLVETALRMNKEFKFLPRIDLVPDVLHRVNAPPEDYPLCDSKEMIIYPKAAKNQEKEWIFIINQSDFRQSVRIETCGKENSVCNLVDGFAEGYKTICKQKYIYRELMAVSSVGQIKPEIFKFPVSCCCHVKFIGNPLIRIGLTNSKKNGVSTFNSHIN